MNAFGFGCWFFYWIISCYAKVWMDFLFCFAHVKQFVFVDHFKQLNYFKCFKNNSCELHGAFCINIDFFLENLDSWHGYIYTQMNYDFRYPYFIFIIFPSLNVTSPPNFCYCTSTILSFSSFINNNLKSIKKFIHCGNWFWYILQLLQKSVHFKCHDLNEELHLI